MQLLPNKYPNEIGLIGHTIINYPNAKAARELIDVLVANGCSLIELQIPFSEPIADGPMFTKANQAAIESGITIEDCYAFMADMTARHDIPFVFMTYANIAYKQGYENFVKRSKEAGAKGAIIPDLPLDLAPEYVAICKAEEFGSVSVVSPNISEARLQTMQPFLDGFVYAVARSGVTGSKTSFDEALISYLSAIRAITALPIAVGFGVSSVEDLTFLKGKADYAVIGTQTMRLFEQQGVAGVANFWQELASVI